MTAELKGFKDLFPRSFEQVCPMPLPDKDWFELYTNLVSEKGFLCDPTQSCCNPVGNHFGVISNYLNVHVAVLKQLLLQETDPVMGDILKREIQIASSTSAIEQEISKFPMSFDLGPIYATANPFRVHKKAIEGLKESISELNKFLGGHKAGIEASLAEKESLQKELVTFRQQSDALREQYQTLQNRIKTSQEERRQLPSLTGLSPFSPLYRTRFAAIQKKEDEILKLQQASDKIFKQHTELEEDIKNHQDRIQVIGLQLSIEPYRTGVQKLAELRAKDEQLRKLEIQTPAIERAYKREWKAVSEVYLKGLNQRKEHYKKIEELKQQGELLYKENANLENRIRGSEEELQQLPPLTGLHPSSSLYKKRLPAIQNKEREISALKKLLEAGLKKSDDVDNRIKYHQQEIKKIDLSKAAKYMAHRTEYAAYLQTQISTGMCFPAGWVGTEAGHAIYLWIQPNGSSSYRIVAFNLGAGIETFAPGVRTAGSFCYPVYFDIPAADITAYLDGLIRCKLWGDTPLRSYQDTINAIYGINLDGRRLGTAPEPFTARSGIPDLREREQTEGNCIVKGYLHGLRFRINNDACYRKLYLSILNSIFENIKRQQPDKVDGIIRSNPGIAIKLSEAAFRDIPEAEIQQQLPALYKKKDEKKLPPPPPKPKDPTIPGDPAPHLSRNLSRLSFDAKKMPSHLPLQDEADDPVDTQSIINTGISWCREGDRLKEAKEFKKAVKCFLEGEKYLKKAKQISEILLVPHTRLNAVIKKCEDDILFCQLKDLLQSDQVAEEGYSQEFRTE